MGFVSKGNIIFAKKTDKESPSCEFMNMCYHIVLLTQIERCNWISEDSDNEKITLDIPPIKKAQFGYQADHKEVRTSTAKRWKSLDFQRFSFCPIRHNTAEFGTWAWVLRESHASWGKWLTIAGTGEWVACRSVFYCDMQSWHRRLRVHGSTLRPHFSKHKARKLTSFKKWACNGCFSGRI